VLDLYQFHAVTTMDDLDTITGNGGAFETFQRARDEGLTRFLGITTHGMYAPQVALEAVERMGLDTVMVPINPRLYAEPDYRADVVRLLTVCQEQNVGVQVIKHAAKQPWGDREKTLNPWYEPYVDQGAIDASVRFALSQPGVSVLASPGDVSLLPIVLQAAKNYTPMSESEQDDLIAERADEPIIFHGPQPISK
jgi:predicted aldo/keto reductase-like oxidoreductase